ncbi:unnamed protein product [Rotaria socialis]|uniref:Uncharacterized protein n=1 Tax=Rotaria socialis TaxID=392032 RepID=A0A821PQI1_9BILA|nr:unnamed protein product [Rotaria socialis]CAF3707963.1 unnamed protein product [Rotaria socialis]CAF4656666.1 unnamed protein product [Rotaria socialis]CAF4811451.1 unnamed protein product [Rotaria socialis]
MNIVRDPTILQYLFETSRLGNNEINITSVPAIDNLSALEECGIKHKFKGRINIRDETGNIRYRTFIPDGIELHEGKWYFRVKLPLGGAAQIGWVTNGFNPVQNGSYGAGDNRFS